MGSVHGRFQPLHNGHLEYIREAARRTELLFIGLTQFRRRQLIQVEADDAVHRAQPNSNPLTYYERLQVIDAVMNAEGLSSERYRVTPFPIEEPSELLDFLPVSVTIFTTTYDAWNREKIRLLEELGYTVQNLWTRTTKAVSGATVRQLMVDGDSAWMGLVPAVAVPLLEEFELPTRLRRLHLGDE
jgi:cytidyltransferase-like protein